MSVTVRAEEPLCRPFRVHLSAPLPPPPPANSDLRKCIDYYLNLDINKNGVADWTTGATEGALSNVLFPRDEDLDGDGVANLFDPDPFDPKVPAKKPDPKRLPPHLAMSGDRGTLQNEIFSRFNVVVVDHTDEHSVEVLRALMLLFSNGIPESTRKELSSVRIIYAFKGHDSSVNIAAYHRHAKALSIGGVSSYGSVPLSPELKVQVLSSLAHEVGHAFLFDRMSTAELLDIGAKFGNWSVDPKAGSSQMSFLDKTFLKSHPFRRLARLAGKSAAESPTFVAKSLWRESNLVSEYATTNMHEWFADAFAAAVLHDLGDRGQLGPGWRERLGPRLAAHTSGYWVNYNNLSPTFKEWLSVRMLASPSRIETRRTPTAH